MKRLAWAGLFAGTALSPVDATVTTPASVRSIIADKMAEAPLYVAESAKSIVDLEFCVARALGATEGVPSGVYRDGPNRVVVLAYRHSEYKVFLAINLIGMSSGTRIEVRGRNEHAAKQFAPAFDDCK